MLGNAAIWILPLIASCHGAALSSAPRLAVAGAIGPDSEAVGNAGPLRQPGYVRMPVARHKFNGTGKSHKGWHWSSPPGTQGFPPPPPCVWSSSSALNTTATGQQTASVRPTLLGSTGQSTIPWSSFPTPSFSISASTSSLALGLSTLTTVGRVEPTASATAAGMEPYLAPRALQADRRWGWSSLDELGGIAYVMERKYPLLLWPRQVWLSRYRRRQR
jgi:hypothetical protein